MSLTISQELSRAQPESLARIAHYRTRYEIEIVHPDGRRALLSYSESVSYSTLRQLIYDRANAIIWFLSAPDDADLTRPRGASHFEISGGGIVRKSGRTQREAIMAGELPFILDLFHAAADQRALLEAFRAAIVPPKRAGE